MKQAVTLLSAALLILLTAAPVAAAPSAWAILGYHIVQPGETLFCIGRAYGVDPWAIAAANGVGSPYHLYAGTALAIPDAYAYIPPGPVCRPQWSSPVYPSCIAYHTVVRGDTLSRIARWYGVSMWRIAEVNGIYNLNYIRAGSVLCIPDP
jgi:LysM repeat protein